MILVVDHYDSVTYNLVQLVEGLGHETEVVKSDAETAAALVAREPAAVILSPGPGRPEDAGVFPALLGVLPATTPVLGVCLGHQAMGLVAGGRVDRAARRTTRTAPSSASCWPTRRSAPSTRCSWTSPATTSDVSVCRGACDRPS